MGRLILVFSMVLGCLAATAAAQSTAIRLQAREEVVITKPVVTLSDIAQIESPRVQDDETLIALKKIVVGSSPKIGESLTIEGTDILAKLRSEGVRLDQIRYSVPRQVVVTRAFREVTTDELELALASFLEREDRQIDVKKLVVERPIRIAPDSDGVEVVSLNSAQPGRFGVDFRSLASSDEVRFQLRAIGDEWRLMPVAAKPLKRGELVAGDAVELVKMSASVVGRDTVENISDIVGHAVTRDVGQGELFRITTLSMPPVVRAGSRVTLVVKRGLLEASATGVALENGGVRQEIKVRNDVSKRIVVGKVVEEGLVSVEVR
jgi:flagella basal body P-ring formation protein FlgA